MTPLRPLLIVAAVIPVGVVHRAWAAVYPEGPREAVGLLLDCAADIRRRVGRRLP